MLNLARRDALRGGPRGNGPYGTGDSANGNGPYGPNGDGSGDCFDPVGSGPHGPGDGTCNGTGSGG